MKKILGLDLGTASIGWAYVNEAETESEKSEIIKLGVRIIQYDTFSKVDSMGTVSESKNPQEDFVSGKGLSPNAKRTKQRGARRNLQRFKLRRQNLNDILIQNGFINNDTCLSEEGNNSTHKTLKIRAQATKTEITLEELSKVLFSINKKRGYKSSRKANSEEEGGLIDGMAIAKELYENNLTPGSFVFQLLKEKKTYIPDFYKSDLQEEFDKIWNKQKEYYTDLLNEELYINLKGGNKNTTWAICKDNFHLEGIDPKGNKTEKRFQNYSFRNDALNQKLELEHLAIVLQEINNDLNETSGYLGAISDRSKELYFNKITVGEYSYNKIIEDRHFNLRNKVFYRQDYMDEFEKIWNTQAKFHKELSEKLKKEIRDVIIFFQRKLKSQKHLISNCKFEKFHKAIPKSSPLFQEFKIWQNLNKLIFINKKDSYELEFKSLDDNIKQEVFEELNLGGKLKTTSINKLIFGKDYNDWKGNLKEIEGNKTNKALYNIYQTIAEREGYGFDWKKKKACEIKEELKIILPSVGINNTILDFDNTIIGTEFDKQASIQLWHLLYSAEDDNKITEEDKLIYGNTNVNLKKKLNTKYGFKAEYGNLLANIRLQDDYGSLSTKAIKKILPHLAAGNNFYEACSIVGYNHSNSLTKEQRDSRVLDEKIEILKKNSLRNSVVEKILNQMVNVVNLAIDTYGKPDEIRVELAWELKKSAKDRQNMTKRINESHKANDEIRKTLATEFNIKSPSRNDIIRYKLYKELKENGYNTLYTNQYISTSDIFSSKVEIEHIIPKAKLFDDSFYNKTLAFNKENLEKADTTAYDYINNKHISELCAYKQRVENLFDKKEISKSKKDKLLLAGKDIYGGFLKQDLNNSQYIARQACQMLENVAKNVMTTTGSITNKLSEDWNIVNIMKELNLPKYRKLGKTEKLERRSGNIEIITGWTKRDDHRHHAMYALTIAFSSPSHIQYLNNLNAISDIQKKSVKHEESKLAKLKYKLTYLQESKNGSKKRLFIPPTPNFRKEAKKHLENILISFKAQNKVMTRNKNKIKKTGKDNTEIKIQLTPRGQLHKETVYAKRKNQIIKEIIINAKTDLEKINGITKPLYRDLLLKRLRKNGNDPKKAFGGKNSLSKNPIYLDLEKQIKLPRKIKISILEDNYTIRKEIDEKLKVEKVIDLKVRKILLDRIKEFGGRQKQAFSDLDKNPIWYNKEKGISIKRVRISGVSNAEALHDKKDKNGKIILDENNNPIANDFVNTGNNHHIAIYRDNKGQLQEKAVSFHQVTTRVTEGLPSIDKKYKIKEGWVFLFTMKKNEMFIFPNEDFNPKGINLYDTNNNEIISPNLYRVQSISTKDYTFRHHLETSIINNIKDITYKRIRTPENLNDVIKIRINHLGQIVAIGEEELIKTYTKELEIAY